MNSYRNSYHDLGRQRPKARIAGYKLSAGFTLVELLVVITIIGMLMALLMPAVSAAREAARRLTCQNNIKQVMFACKGYATAKGGLYPGWINSITGANGKTFNAPWVATLLPYIERSDLYASIKANNSMPTSSSTNSQPLLKVLICPTDPPDSLASPAGPSAYICNGLVFRDARTGLTSSPLPPPPLDDSYLTQNDGQSSTLMISENLAHDPTNPAGPTAKFHNWYDCPATSTTPVTMGIPAYTATQQTQTFGAPLGAPPNGPYTVTTYPTATQTYASAYFPPNNLMSPNIRSAHGGGANVGFFDSHVGFMSDASGSIYATGSTTVTVYQELVTPDGTTIAAGIEPPVDESEMPN